MKTATSRTAHLRRLLLVTFAETAASLTAAPVILALLGYLPYLIAVGASNLPFSGSTQSGQQHAISPWLFLPFGIAAAGAEWSWSRREQPNRPANRPAATPHPSSAAPVTAQ